jgi:uncharacterized membrane protein
VRGDSIRDVEAQAQASHRRSLARRTVRAREDKCDRLEAIALMLLAVVFVAAIYLAAGPPH